MHRLRKLAFTLLLAPLVACGGNAFNVRSLDSGSLTDRYINLVESQFALIAQSSSPADAVSRIEDYCAREAAAIEQIRKDGEDLTEAEQNELGKQVAPSLEKLIKRAESELEKKAHILGDQSVLTAMANCAPRPMAEPQPE
jgi:hypothetical protein